MSISFFVAQSQHSIWSLLVILDTSSCRVCEVLLLQHKITFYTPAGKADV